MARQPAVEERPQGLVSQRDFLDKDEERRALAVVAEMEFDEIRMRGQAARRTVRHFGYAYEYETWRLHPTEPLPPELGWLRDRAGAFADVRPADFAQILVSRYPPGATIGWHRDAPMFGAKVVGVSLGAPCRLRLRRIRGGTRSVFALDLPPRSAYLLSGPARSAWQHSIPPVKDLRYSVTFRTVRRRDRGDE